MMIHILFHQHILYKTIPDWNHLPPAAIESRSILNSSFQEPTERLGLALVGSAAQHHPLAWYSTEEDCEMNILSSNIQTLLINMFTSLISNIQK